MQNKVMKTGANPGRAIMILYPASLQMVVYNKVHPPFRSMALAELVEFHRPDITHYVSSYASTASCRVLRQLHA